MSLPKLRVLDEPQRARRTHLHAHAAVLADSYRLGIVEFGFDHRLEASVDKTKDSLLRLLFTDAYAEIATYALALITLNADELRLHKSGMELPFQTLHVATQLVRVADETAIRIVVAATFETALGFCHGGLRRKAKVDLLEIVFALLR